MSKEILSDELLKESLKKAQEVKSARYEEQISQSRQHTFSREYRMRIKKLENEADYKVLDHKAEFKTTSYVAKKENLKLKILLVAIIVMLMGSITALAVEIWEAYENEIIEWNFFDDTDNKKFNEKKP